MDIATLYNLLKSLGQDVVGCDSNGNIQGENLDQTLINLLLAAIDTPMRSDEHVALKQYLGGATDPRWQAYIQERRRPIREKREAKFRELTDAVFAKSFELAEGARDVTIGQVVYRLPTAAKIKAWEDRKTAIRAELKYPDEE